MNVNWVYSLVLLVIAWIYNIEHEWQLRSRMTKDEASCEQVRLVYDSMIITSEDVCQFNTNIHS